MRTQLRQLVAAITSLVLAAFVVPLGLLLRWQAEDRAMVAASLQAQSVSALVATAEPAALRVALDQINSRQAQNITVFLPNGTAIGDPGRIDDAVKLARRGLSFAADAPGGREFLVPVQGLPRGTAVIRTFVPERELHRGVTRAWLVLGGLAIALLALAVVLADGLGRNLVRPIRDLAGTADRLAAGDLAARAAPEGPPEIRRVGAELNRLADRIRVLLAAEREEVADLAHRLRTPVAALRLDADSLRTEEEARRIEADVDVLERVVDEVIRSARRPVREGAGASCDLAAVTVERARYWSALAEDDDRDLQVSTAAFPVPVRVSREDLEVVIDALIGNVFTHTPERTPLWILVERADSGGRLIVEDAGPGFPDAGVLSRGRTGSGRNGSTGLGLDISRRTAEVSGGQVTLGVRGGGGAQVIVDFGAPSADNRT